MGTNGTDIATEPRLEEDRLRIPKVELTQADWGQTLASLDKTPAKKRAPGGPEATEATEDFVLAPLVDKIAYGIARGLVVAVKELENHIANETRKVGDAVDRRLDTLQTSLQDLYNFAGEQRASNSSVQGQLQELKAGLEETDARQAADVEAIRKEAQEFSVAVSQRIETSTASLQESDARQAAELDALRTETREASSSVSERVNVQGADLAALQNETKLFSQAISERVDGLCKDLGIHQEDIAAVKTALCTFSSRVDTLVERLDRQAEAVRSMCTAYSQRETELEQLVDGLARLRAFPTPLPKTGL